jgi:hypothetical protein
MAMKEQRKPLRDIRAVIDARYGRSGPATPTPLPK